MNRRSLLLGALALPVAAHAAPSPRRTYLRAHRSWTRELVLYWDGSTALLLRATLLEPAFRAALAEERRRLLDVDEADHAAFLERMRADGEQYVEFVFAADSAFPEAEKFGPGDDRWNLRCLADGAALELSAVDQVRRPSPLHRALYDQHNQWSELWIARFTRSVGRPAWVELHVGGGYGNGACHWDVA
jgi:hypothetical protein